MQNNSGKIIGTSMARSSSGSKQAMYNGQPLDTTNCPVRQVLDRIGDKWSTLVVLLLGDSGVMRFNGIAQAIGDISQKMLTATLRNLEADGLVSRKMYQEIPPRVEYELTELGRSLVPLIRALEVWADEHFQAIKRNRKQYATKTGAAH
jgi:DNA-binding HxlR family transcriptional regulator